MKYCFDELNFVLWVFFIVCSKNCRNFTLTNSSQTFFAKKKKTSATLTQIIWWSVNIPRFASDKVTDFVRRYPRPRKRETSLTSPKVSDVFFIAALLKSVVTLHETLQATKTNCENGAEFQTIGKLLNERKKKTNLIIFFFFFFFILTVECVTLQTIRGFSHFSDSCIFLRVRLNSRARRKKKNNEQKKRCANKSEKCGNKNVNFWVASLFDWGSVELNKTNNKFCVDNFCVFRNNNRSV